MRIVCWQTILMEYHNLFFFRKLGKMLQNLSSAAVSIGAIRVNAFANRADPDQAALFA